MTPWKYLRFWPLLLASLHTRNLSNLCQNNTTPQYTVHAMFESRFPDRSPSLMPKIRTQHSRVQDETHKSYSWDPTESAEMIQVTSAGKDWNYTSRCSSSAQHIMALVSYESPSSCNPKRHQPFKVHWGSRLVHACPHRTRDALSKVTSACQCCQISILNVNDTGS